MAKKTTTKKTEQPKPEKVLNMLAFDEDKKIVQVKVKMDFRMDFIKTFDIKEVPNAQDIPAEWLAK